jgi:hypothetical protein
LASNTTPIGTGSHDHQLKLIVLPIMIKMINLNVGIKAIISKAIRNEPTIKGSVA